MSDIEFGSLHVFGCNASCPVCGEPPEQDAVACPRCGTPHHADCWEYTGRCALYACRAERLRPVPPLGRRVREWVQSLARPTNPDHAMPFGRAIALCMAGLIGSSAILPTFGYMRMLRLVDQEVRQRGTKSGYRARIATVRPRVSSEALQQTPPMVRRR